MDDRPRIECSDHAVDPSYLVGGNEVCLVEENHIGKVNLVGQQVHNGTFIGVPYFLSAVDELLGRREVPQEIWSINYSDHCIDFCDFAQRGAIFIFKSEGFCDRHGLRYSS